MDAFVNFAIFTICRKRYYERTGNKMYRKREEEDQ